MADICGRMWVSKTPCDLGSTTDHECWNSPECSGDCMCACEEERVR